MALGKESELKQIAVIADKKGLTYLKSKGISPSKFFRQAVKAEQNGKFEFDFMEA